MKVQFKDVKFNFAADICGEGQGEAEISLGEISLEASSSEIIAQARELASLCRDMVREDRGDKREERRHRETVERIRARRWARRDDKQSLLPTLVSPSGLA